MSSCQYITPQAVFAPELPDGWVVKSSGWLWMILTFVSQIIKCQLKLDKDIMFKIRYSVNSLEYLYERTGAQ